MALERILSNDISLSWQKPKKCTVCFDVFSFNLYDVPEDTYGRTCRPHILSCYHNACENCIKKSHLNTIKCGDCGVKTNLDSNLNLPSTQIMEPNFYLNGLLYYVENELHSALEQNYKAISNSNVTLKTINCVSSKQQKCYECNFETNCFCIQCSVPYCRKCYETVHKTAKALRKHSYSLLGRSSLNLTNFPGYNKNYGEHQMHKCKIHPKKYFDHYCNDCYQACCGLCSPIDHEGHDVKTIEEKNNDYMPILQTLIGTVKAAREKTRTSIKVSS